jgi:hypothetical protein
MGYIARPCLKKKQTNKQKPYQDSRTISTAKVLGAGSGLLNYLAPVIHRGSSANLGRTIHHNSLQFPDSESTVLILVIVTHKASARNSCSHLRSPFSTTFLKFRRRNST